MQPNTISNSILLTNILMVVVAIGFLLAYIAMRVDQKNKK